MKALIIQPPKYFWPYISSDDNFLVPQALPYLGAIARRDGHEIKLIDCSPTKTGWKSLAKIIETEKPDLVGVGENHALYSHESLKILKLVKEICPSAATIAGGSHFSNLIEETLRNNYIDAIAIREGEITFSELLERVASGSRDFSNIKGIACMKDGAVVRTAPRPLVDDLDSLPMPAYDMLPMHLYGKSKYLFSPGGATIHHSRGCVSNCRFCAWWLQMAETVEAPDGTFSYKPKWRTKSVEYTIEEIKILSEKFGKRCLVFVDEYWNQDPQWNSDFADAVLKQNLKFEWFAFMRADGVLRDESLGIFEKLVKTGLAHVAIGVERVEHDELKNMGKGFYSSANSINCFHMLRDKYPGVFRQGTFIVGVRSETKETMLAQADFAKKLDLDYPGFHPITPVPGTAFWKEASENNWIEVNEYSEYDWMTPIISSEFMTRREIEDLLITLSKRFVSLKWFVKGIFSKARYKRMMYAWWLLVTIRIVIDSVVRLMPIKTKTYSGLVKPSWYDD